MEELSPKIRGIASDCRYPLAPGLTQPERLGEGHRAVDEIRLRRYERHPDTVAGRIAQRHKRFQGGDTAAHDHHLGRRPELGHGLTPRLSRAVVNGPTDESAACAATVFSHEMAEE
jgi:hypothetical protein